VTGVTSRRLAEALLACASGIRHLEAGTSLLIDSGSWLHREDFTSRFITTGTSMSDRTTILADTDWEAAIAALHAGELPASSGDGGCSSWPPASPAGPLSASATPCQASTAATQAWSSAPLPMSPESQNQNKKRTNSIKTVSSEKQMNL
jgi:hypothetical protein